MVACTVNKAGWETMTVAIVLTGSAELVDRFDCVGSKEGGRPITFLH